MMGGLSRQDLSGRTITAITGGCEYQYHMVGSLVIRDVTGQVFYGLILKSIIMIIIRIA